jgi:hypothetical protein
MLGVETSTHVTMTMGTIVTTGRSMCVSGKAQFGCSKVVNQRLDQVCNLALKQKKINLVILDTRISTTKFWMIGNFPEATIKEI